MASLVTPLRVAPSGPRAEDIDVTGWTLWRSLDDLPDPDGFGVRSILPGGYQLVNDIEVPLGQQIRCIQNVPYGNQGHHIVGGGHILQRAAGGDTVPIFYVDEGAYACVVDGVTFQGHSGDLYLVTIDNQAVLNCSFSGCQFIESVTLIDIIGTAADGCAQFINCLINGGTTGIEHGGEWLSCVGCDFVGLTRAIHVNSTKARVEVHSCYFWALADGINISVAGSVGMIGCDLGAFTNGINIPAGISARVRCIGNDADNGGALVTTGAATPSGGCNIIGNTLSGSVGALTNILATDPDAFLRGNIHNSARLTESVITP